jgi:threonyl-tRNA synthetase
MAKNKYPIEVVRHTLAHVMAYAVKQQNQNVKFGIGPIIDDGFYYDFDLPHKFSDKDFADIEKRMRKIIEDNLPVEHLFLDNEEAIRLMRQDSQEYKIEILEEIKRGERPANIEDADTQSKDGKISFYKIGKFMDLCKGPHVSSTGELPKDSFKLSHVAGAYWRGSEKNAQLQRIYAFAFENKAELDKHVALLEEARRRDHKKLGPELDLFTFSELVGPGLPLWTPKGTLLRNLLDDFVWSLRKQSGYVQVDIPHITKKELYETSGHWDKFKDELFKITTREGHVFAMKPMNCPHHTQIYARKPHSYRDLPQRYANTTKDYRDEQTGELSGLSRVRAFTQDDAHVFCRMSQVKEEFLKIWDIVHEFYPAFGLELKVRLSRHDPKHPEKYLGDEKKWKLAEDILNGIIKEKKVKAIDGLGEAAFYGPKLDFMAKDSLGREWQVATIQLDMNMPERFGLECINEKGEHERIVMIHAAIMGSIERFLSIIIEHFAGAFPLWLSPVQAMILPITDKQNKWADKVAEELRFNGIRVDINKESETLGKKIRASEMQKIPYLLIIGDKEQKAKAVAVRQRGKGDIGKQALPKILKTLLKEIALKK